MKRVHGDPVYWISPNENVAVTYNVFGMGSRFSIYRKKIYGADYGGTSYWEYMTSFTFIGEAVSYAKMIRDVAVTYECEECENT